MGNWDISIQGVGTHHNPGREEDAEKMAKKFVEELRKAGHHVTHARFTYGGAEDIDAG